MMSASLVAGQITMRTGHYKIFPVIGTSLLVIALVLLTTGRRRHGAGADRRLHVASSASVSA